MVETTTRRRGAGRTATRGALAIVLAGAVALSACGSSSSDTPAAAKASIPAKPEPGTFVLATQPWIGYGIYDTVAQQQGIFAREGLKVRTVNFTSDKDANAAIAAGRVDAMNVGISQALQFAEAGLPIKIVMLEDTSTTADGIVAQSSIHSIADLKGKKVGVEVGSVTDMEVAYALQQAGLKQTDVEKVDVPPLSIGAAVLSGAVDAGVMSEPLISESKAQGLRLIWTAGEAPGLVGDALVVREDVMDKRPGQVAAMIRAWQEGLDWYHAHPAAAKTAIAKDLGTPPAELASAFDGLGFFSVAQSREQLNGKFLPTLGHIIEAAKISGIIQQTPAPSSVIDARFVDAAQG